MHDYDPLSLHVDHSLECVRELPVPLGDLGPNGVAQLILRVGRHGDLAVLAGEQKPQD
jgi:hypothetical protein